MLNRLFNRLGENRTMQLSGWMLTILVIASPATATQDEFDRGFTLGQLAYKYGLPLVTMQWTYDVQTSTTPVNSLRYYRQFATPSDTTVVAPNFDTLYAVGWLDLSKGPVIIHVPAQMFDEVNGVRNRFWVFAMYDPYTNNFANLGSVQKSAAGDYVLFGPNAINEHIPPSPRRIASPYNRVWVIARIYAINGNEDDINYVNSLQDRMTVKPVGNWLAWWIPFWNRDEPTQPGVSNPVMPTGMAYYDALCQQLSLFPPPAQDSQFLASLLDIGIKRGATPSKNQTLSADTVAGMIAAVANGSAAVRADVVAKYRATFSIHNGYLVLPTGVYGTDYSTRAIITQIGLGALVPEVAIYPVALFDRLAQPLVGTKNYVVHIPKGGLPPVTGFWSLTMYNISGFLIANEINRYLINDRSNLYYNADGSVDLFIQAVEPTDQNKRQNWLPSPTAPFEMIWRLYALQPNAVAGVLDGTGWQPPAVMPVS